MSASPILGIVSLCSAVGAELVSLGGNERTCTFETIFDTIGIMAWIYLVIAGLLEIGWAIGLKYTEGFSRLWPSVATISAMIASFGLLAAALKTIPVGTGYAVWTGIGAAGTAIIGMVFLGESREIMRILCLVLIVAGAVGLKFASSTT